MQLETPNCKLNTWNWKLVRYINRQFQPQTQDMQLTQLLAGTFDCSSLRELTSQALQPCSIQHLIRGIPTAKYLFSRHKTASQTCHLCMHWISPCYVLSQPKPLTFSIQQQEADTLCNCLEKYRTEQPPIQSSPPRSAVLLQLQSTFLPPTCIPSTATMVVDLLSVHQSHLNFPRHRLENRFE